VIDPIPLHDGVVLRQFEASDSTALAAACLRNRERLAEWEPVRPESFFTVEGQSAELAIQLESAATGSSVPLALVHVDSGMVVGRFSITGIIRGPFLSANLGYWVDGAFEGRGLATAAVGAIISLARDDLGLHRLQAGTLPRNVASQAVLRRNGFDRIGFAPRYLRIAGEWQDHDLFQVILHD
jgi:[ribosomal protein S5]-alanine N-acetyltransferase